MATRVTTTLYDDLDESTDKVRTVRLSFDGSSVEVDLGKKNYDKLAKAVGPYLDAGRRVSAPKRLSSAPKNADPTEIRAWAAENGTEVSARGRIPVSVVEEYNAR